MTARRRRKSGSGPSASALIAWVGGSQADIATHTGAPVSVIGDEPADPGAGGRAILLGRACGLTAGTLLAFGSVLVGATNVEVGGGAPVFNPLPATPDVAMDTPAEYHADAPADPGSVAPDQVRAQAVTETTLPLRPRPGQIHRNVPVSVGVPATDTEPSAPSGAVQQPSNLPPPAKGQAPQGPVAPISPAPVDPAPVDPVLDPAAQGVGRVAPVGGLLAPKKPTRDVSAASPREQQAILPAPPGAMETVKQVVVRPVMGTLGSLLPIR